MVPDKLDRKGRLKAFALSRAAEYKLPTYLLTDRGQLGYASVAGSSTTVPFPFRSVAEGCRGFDGTYVLRVGKAVLLPNPTNEDFYDQGCEIALWAPEAKRFGRWLEEYSGHHGQAMGKPLFKEGINKCYEGVHQLAVKGYLSGLPPESGVSMYHLVEGATGGTSCFSKRGTRENLHGGLHVVMKGSKAGPETSTVQYHDFFHMDRRCINHKLHGHPNDGAANPLQVERAQRALAEAVLIPPCTSHSDGATTLQLQFCHPEG